jgi:hypothetical protein
MLFTSVVKFFTLDDSLMWVLKRVTSHTPNKSPHAHALNGHVHDSHAHAVEALAQATDIDGHHPLAHIRSSPTLVDECVEGTQSAKELYTTNVLAAAASIASPLPPSMNGNSGQNGGRL